MTRIQHHLLLVSLSFVLLFGRTRLESGNAAAMSGDSAYWDDADDVNDMANKTQLGPLARPANVTRNASDFTYANLVARDKHEVILNLQRTKNKLSPPRNPRKKCMRNCQRRHLVCLHDLGVGVRKDHKPCAICVSQCSGLSTASPHG